MSAFALPLPQSLQPPAVWQRLVTTNRFLALNLIFYVGLLVLTIGATFVDPRLIAGAPAWIKPMKFAISSILYAATLLWMLSFVRGRPRWVALIAFVTTVGLFVELAGISIQAFRGFAAILMCPHPWTPPSSA